MEEEKETRSMARRKHALAHEAFKSRPRREWMLAEYKDRRPSLEYGRSRKDNPGA